MSKTYLFKIGPKPAFSILASLMTISMLNPGLFEVSGFTININLDIY
jgi:hypothetical protein